jgi:hypothetical protein
MTQKTYYKISWDYPFKVFVLKCKDFWPMVLTNGGRCQCHVYQRWPVPLIPMTMVSCIDDTDDQECINDAADHCWIVLIFNNTAHQYWYIWLTIDQENSVRMLFLLKGISIQNHIYVNCTSIYLQHSLKKWINWESAISESHILASSNLRL